MHLVFCFDWQPLNSKLTYLQKSIMKLRWIPVSVSVSVLVSCCNACCSSILTLKLLFIAVAQSTWKGGSIGKHTGTTVIASQASGIRKLAVDTAVRVISTAQRKTRLAASITCKSVCPHSTHIRGLDTSPQHCSSRESMVGRKWKTDQVCRSSGSLSLKTTDGMSLLAAQVAWWRV